MRSRNWILLVALLAAALGGACGRAGSGASDGGDAGHGSRHPDFDWDRGNGGDDDDDDGGSTGTPDPEETPVETPEESPTPVSTEPTPDPTPSPEPEPTASPEPTPDPGSCVPTPQDLDCDGIPDPVDNIPCESFTLVITNVGVSSAEILINGVAVAGPNDFPTSQPIVMAINPVSGVNVLTVGGKLAGSPGDQFRFQVVDGDGNGWLDQVVTRGPGQPGDVDVAFDVGVLCD